MGDDSAAEASGGTGGAARAIDPEKITTSTRDPEVMAGQLGAWLAGVLPAGADPVVEELTSPQGNGMSSETLLVDVATTGESGRSTRRLVVRVAPPEAAYPVFPTYDLAMQHRVMGLVAEATEVPVPATHCQLKWLLARSPSIRWLYIQSAAARQCTLRTCTTYDASHMRAWLCR